MLKNTLLSLALVATVAALIVGMLVFLKSVAYQQDSIRDTDSVSDESKDYEVCTEMDTGRIKAALGSVADDVQPGINMTIATRGETDSDTSNLIVDSQLCSYALTSSEMDQDGFDTTNALLMQVTKYSSEDTIRSFVEQIRMDGQAKEVQGLDGAAFYSTSTASEVADSIHTFRLQVLKGDTMTVYTLRQPAEGATLTEDSAEAALVDLVKE